ncbi:MAG: hypothetical protein ACXAC2_20030, partial [Candidatus Kariarchaeaceae archaeon]
MDFKTIHDYFDDTFALRQEYDNYIVFGVPETEYEITFIPVIAKVSDSLKKQITETIYDMIGEDPSHSVAGTYTIENITKRPDNIYILFTHNNSIEFIFNIKENEEILIHSYLFSKFTDPVGYTVILNHIILFLSTFETAFIFGSGLDLVKFLKQNYEYDNISEQNVYRLMNLKVIDFKEQ